MAEHLKQIGSVDKLAGSVSVRHPDGSQSTLQAGSPVYQGDQVETAADGRVGIVFVDKSTFSLGPKGRMTMDEMVFDPAHPQDGHATVAALNGAFSYVSGQIAKSAPESMQIKTPVMTIGVRGTTVAGMAAAEGSANTVTLMRDGSGQLGQIVITTAAGSVVLNGESHTIQISSFIQPPPAPTALSAAA
ncbi:MAG: FecR domain-containing protein, partial [Bacteroidales bacterium]